MPTWIASTSTSCCGSTTSRRPPTLWATPTTRIDERLGRRRLADRKARHVARRGAALQDALGDGAVDDRHRLLPQRRGVIGSVIDRRARFLDGGAQVRHRGAVARAMLDHLPVLLLGRRNIGHGGNLPGGASG